MTSRNQVSLKTEFKAFGATHTIESTIPEVYSDEINGARDGLLRQHAESVRVLTSAGLIP